MKLSPGWLIYRLKCTILLYVKFDLELRQCWAYSRFFRQGYCERLSASEAVERELDNWLE